MKKLMLSTLALLACSSARADIPYADNPNRPFNEYTWISTHNAFATTILPSQTLSIREQLDAGVRSLMLDLHYSAGAVRLCHGSCIGPEPTFSSLLNGTILPFLSRQPDAIVTLHLEDYVNRTELAHAFSSVTGLAPQVFNPNRWATAQWPTHQQMVDSGQQLLVFSQRLANSGDMDTASGPLHVMYDSDYTVENYWSIGDTIFTHDHSCRSRWNSVPLDTAQVWNRTWSRLFVMNHFHTSPFGDHAPTDNNYNVLRSRIDNECHAAARRKPNFVAVDFFHNGQLGSVAGSLNMGTIELFDGVSGTGNRLCAIPARASHSESFASDKGHRCPPRKARSAVLRDIPRGTTFRLIGGNDAWNSPAMRVSAAEDLYGKSAVLHNFENGQEFGGVIADRLNGGRLAGEVIRAVVETTP